MCLGFSTQYCLEKEYGYVLNTGEHAMESIIISSFGIHHTPTDFKHV